MKAILVGMSPVKGDPKEPLSGPVGRRLAALAGLDIEDFLDRFERVNLTGSGKRDAVSRADELRAKWKGRNVVLLGRMVAAAFRLNPDGYEYFQAHALEPGFDAIVCPHPSEKTHWWDDEGTVIRAREWALRFKLNLAFLIVRRNGKRQFSLDQMRAALEAGRGVFSWSAKALTEASGRYCCRATVSKYVHDYYPEELAEVGRAQVSEILDAAKHNIIRDIEAGGVDSSWKLMRSRNGQGTGYELVVHAKHSGTVAMEHRHEIAPDLAAALSGASTGELEAMRSLYGRMIEGEAEVLEIAEVVEEEKDGSG